MRTATTCAWLAKFVVGGTAVGPGLPAAKSDAETIGVTLLFWVVVHANVATNGAAVSVTLAVEQLTRPKVAEVTVLPV